MSETETQLVVIWHTVVFVLVNPAVPFLSLDHKFIVSKAGIDERIDKCTREICPRRVYIRGRTRSYYPSVLSR
jgi:hypothetical protein